MNAGKMPHRLRIQHNTGTTRGTGGHRMPVWSTFAEVWASVEPLQGREYWNAQQTQSDITHKVRMRWLEGVDSKMQIVWLTNGSTALYMKEKPRQVIEGKKIELEVMCGEEA